jgi:hypothetical protein
MQKMDRVGMDDLGQQPAHQSLSPDRGGEKRLTAERSNWERLTAVASILTNSAEQE